MRALVLAGGGMRGAFASGVTLAFQEAGERFDALYGTSAGGAMAAWFAAGQADDGTRTWKYAGDPAIMNYRRFMTRRGPLIDLDHLYDHVYPNEVGLDTARLQRHKVPVHVTAADITNGHGAYLDLRLVDVLSALKATSALPFVSAGPVSVGDGLYLDGGLTDPIPIARAIRDGATEIAVVLNRPRDERRPEPAAMTWMFSRRYPALARHAAHHHMFCMDAMRLAAAPPEGVTVQVIRPQVPLRVGRFTRDVARLDETVALGHAAGHAWLGA